MKSLEECLTEDEQKHIDEWLQANPGRVEEMQQLKRYAAAGRDIRTFRQINIDDAWKRIDWQTEKAPGWKRRRMAPYWWSAAAVVVLVIVGVLFMNRPKEPVSTTLIASSAGFKPGSQKATWELPGGKLIELEEDGVRLLTGEDGSVLGRDSANTLIVGKGRKGEVEQSVIRVPQGGEYGVVLADGTKVWINSESELSFPSAFEGKDRVVELKGEAYFSVKKDTEKPFLVRSGEYQLKVYGTEFNLNTYKNNEIQAVLVKGSVGFKANRTAEEVRLKPSQLGVANEVTGKTEVNNVDVYPYIAWKNQDVVFVNERLESIMEKAARWYDVNVFFQNESLKDLRFFGNMQRYADIQELLFFLENTSDVRFSVKDRTVVVSGK